MEISSHFVHAHTKQYQTEVTTRLAMNYAAAVGDTNPLFLDDIREGGIIAPPMACLALAWPVTVDYRDTWLPGSFEGDFPFEALERRVHFSDTLVLGRPIQPGERITVEGEITALMAHRAGTHMMVRYDGRDETGEMRFSEYTGVLIRGVRCVDGDRGADTIPEVPTRPEIDEPLWDIPIHLSPLAAHIYDGMTNMHFPIHTSPRFAKSVGLKQPILQGAATLSYAIKEITDREADGDATRIASLSCRFTGMVTPGSDVIVRLYARCDKGKETDLFFEVIMENGRPALSDGHVRLRPSMLDML